MTRKKLRATFIVLAVLAAASIPMFRFALPAIQARLEAWQRVNCSNNMKRIGLAMHLYHNAHKTLPPAYTTDAQGQPLHSWRTLLLPFLDQQALYDQIDLTKPWDDSANQAAAQTIVPVYSCPSMGPVSTLTPYVAIVDPNGVMAGANALRFRDIEDGLAYTVMFTETDRARAVHWMSPEDTDLKSFMAVGDPAHPAHHRGGCHVAICDGEIVLLTDGSGPESREAMVTRAGREFLYSPVPFDLKDAIREADD